MTLPEIAMALDESEDGHRGAPAPNVSVGHAQRLAFLRRYRAMSAAERVDWFLEQRGKL